MAGTSGDWRHQAWLAFLVVAISAFSFVYACAPPFAAFSVLAAMTSPGATRFGPRWPCGSSIRLLVS